MADIKDPENTIVMELKGGTVTIELLPDVAPQHSARMKELARAGAYDNVAFHRVIDGFMAQTGDVANGNMEQDFNIRMAGTGGSDMPDLPAEFSKLPHARGTLGAARSANPNSANSQFFINFSDNDFLNGQYTVYGRVIEGMEHVDAIERGEPPMSPDRMISVKVASDVGGAPAPAAEPEPEAEEAAPAEELEDEVKTAGADDAQEAAADGGDGGE